MLKSINNGHGVTFVTPTPRFRVVATWGNQRAVIERDGNLGSILKEAQDTFKGAQLSITPIK